MEIHVLVSKSCFNCAQYTKSLTKQNYVNMIWEQTKFFWGNWSQTWKEMLDQKQLVVLPSSGISEKNWVSQLESFFNYRFLKNTPKLLHVNLGAVSSIHSLAKNTNLNKLNAFLTLVFLFFGSPELSSVILTMDYGPYSLESRITLVHLHFRNKSDFIEFIFSCFVLQASYS